MDQIKIGSILRELRNEKALTQEQLAEQFGVSSRTVSRWENGKNMPDISILIELADFYDVDIRKLIDGERKSETMNEDLKEILTMISDYAYKQKKQTLVKSFILFGLEMLCAGFTLGTVVLVLKSDGQISAGFAIIPMVITISFSILLVMNAKDYVRSFIISNKAKHVNLSK